jgi:hypothetical protein
MGRAYVGAGLPAIAVFQLQKYQLTDRHRGQARSHRGLLMSRFFEPGADSDVGAGLPAVAVFQLQRYQLTDRHRGQARSHRVLQ